MSYLDTRDLYKRQCELQEELDALEESVNAATDTAEECNNPQKTEGLCDCELCIEVDDARDALKEWLTEYKEELDALNQLENEIGREWTSGETLIPEDEFEDYARDFAKDIHGSEVRNASWPFDCIDWEQAAEELQQDFSTVEYQGDTYFFRG